MEEVRYAGFWRRLAAFIIDVVAIFAILLIVIFVGSFLYHFLGESSVLLTGLGSVLIVVVLFYHTYFLVTKGATPGKAIMGLVVVDKTYNYPLSTEKALLREILGRHIIDQLTFSLGNLLIIFDSKKQALHDKIGGTYVVYKDSLEGSKGEK